VLLLPLLLLLLLLLLLRTDMDLETRMKAWDRKFYALTSFPQVNFAPRTPHQQQPAEVRNFSMNITVTAGYAAQPSCGCSDMRSVQEAAEHNCPQTFSCANQISCAL
jgi:hypothetical protein